MKKKFCLGLLAAALSVGSASAQCVVAGTNFDTNSELCCPTLTSDSEEGGWYNEDLDWDKLCKADMFIGPEYAKQNGIGGVFSSDGSNDMTDIDDIFHLNNLQADGKPAQYGYSTVTAQPKLIHSFCKANEVPNNMYVNIGSAPLCPIVSYTVHGLAPGTTAELSFSLHNLLDPTYFDHLTTNVCVGGGKAPQLSDFISKYNYSNAGTIDGNKLGFGVVSSDDNVQFNTSYNDALQLTNSRNATTATADYGSSTTVTHKATVPATGSVTFYFYRTSDCFQIPIGIDDIKVTGEIRPMISSTGNPCPEQPLRVTTKQSYPEGTTFLWKESVTGQTSTESSFNFIPDKPETDYSITLEVTLPGCDASKSEPLKVHSGTCCTSADGAPMAMTNLFFDDFGNFPSDDTYEWTDRFGTTHTEKIPAGQVHTSQSHGGDLKIPYVKAYNIENSGATLAVPVAGSIPNKTELYNHGVYVVSKYGGYPGGVPYDNSGTQTGGMLQFDLLDDGSQDEFFEIDIEHICTGKEITFGADFASISDHAGSIEVKLEYNGKDLVSEKQNFTGGADGWKGINKSFTINAEDVGSASEVTITMKVKHNDVVPGETRDYAIDNIIFQVCTPPDVNVESSVSTGKDILDLCTEDVLTLTSITSVEGQAGSESAVTRFYTYSNGKPDPNKKVGYVYQYTFQNPSTESETNPIIWNTLHDEEVVESETFDVEVEKYWDNIFSQLEDDPKHEKRIYFRVVVGEYSDLIADQSWKKNSAFSPCRKISISTIPIVAGLNCAACVKAEQPEIIGAEETKVTLGKEMKEVNLCAGEIAHLSTENFVPSDPEEMGVADPTSPHKYIATWHKGSKTAPGVKGIGYTDGDDNTSLNVTYEDADIYYLKVVDFDFPGDDGSSCYMWDSVKVIANPVPEKTLDEVEPFCEGTLAANEAPTLTIDGYKLHWYEDADTTKATKEPSVIDKEAKEYEYFYVLEDSKTGCKGEVNPFSFTVNAIPTKVLEDAKVIEYIKGTGSVDISEKAGLEPTKEEYTLFWSTSAAAGDDGSKTAPKHDITKEDKVGKSYYVYQKNEETGCYGEKSEIVVIVNDSPKPVTKDTVVCKGKTIDDLSSLAKRENEDYELLWYASESDAKEDGVGTPSALTAAQSEAPGEYIFYVAQKNTKTGAISEKAEIKVTVVGVDMPKVEDINYCTGDDAAPLKDNVTLVANESKFTFQSGLEWFVNKNAVKDEPVVETNVINTTPVRYAVRQVYEIPSTGEICQGDTAGFTVKTTFIGLPAVNATVTYVSGDLVGNTFEKNLLQQKEGAVETTDESYSLVWYDAEKNKIGDGKTPPTPVSDPAMVEAGKDQTFTYYVKQTDGTCEGELTEVKVIISSTPMPIVKNINFCEGEEVISIETLAEVNDNKGTIDESLLRLVWVDSDADDAAELAAPPTLSSGIETDEMPVKTTKYYVKQAKKNEDGSESFSSASEIIVKVYAKARLKDEDDMPGPVCEKAVDLKEYWTVSNQVDIELEVYTLDNEKKENIVYKSGLYDVVASFTVPKPNTGSESAGVCASEPHDIDVRIDELAVPGIVGTETTCPNTSAEGLAVEFETNYEGNDIKYSWSEGIKAGSGKEDVSTEILEGVAGDKFDFTVEVTAGTCTKTSPKHTITLGDGPVVGSIKFTEAENTDLEKGMEINVSSGKATLYTCGTMLTMDPTALENTEADFKWTVAGDGSPVGSSASAKVNPTEKTVYRVTYTNKCSTSVDITVIPVPLTVGGAIVGADICENESASIDAQIQCVEKPESIRWSRNGEAVSKYDGEGKLVFEPAKPEDSGEYTCVVTNRACVREIEPQTLLVKPYVKFAPEKEEYVIRRGETVNIINTITVPSDAVPAEITWTDNGKAVENSGKDYSVEVTKDMNLNVEMTEEGKYCPSDVDIVVKVDAVLQLAGEISDANMGEDGNYKMCLGETKTLVIDTTGTGKFVYPEKMSLAVTESQAGGSSKTLSNGTLNSEGKLEFKISPSTDATYSVSFVYREGEGEDEQTEELEIKMTVLQKIEVKVPNGLEVCEGEEVEIALESVTPKGTVITWEDETIEGGKAEGETVVAKPTFSKPANGGHVSTYTYTAYASFDICETAEFPVKVKVNEPLTGELEDVTICENETARLDASSYKATSYIWTSDELETERSGQGITVTPKSTAVFKVSMERGGCKAEDELTVTVNPNPLILQVDSLSYRKIAVVVDATHNGKLTYRIDDGTESSFAEFDSLAYAPHVAYVTDEYGCSSSFDFMINAPLIIPNKWMSPNGDGETDRWEVPAISETYPDAKIVIYDRFGKKLIEYKGSDPGWDGVYNGQLMPTTDYWYEITVHEIDKVYTGHFTLLRR